MFVLSWTVLHVIDSSSPLHGLGPEDLLKKEAEIFVVMTGWDETFAQTIHARKSYGPDEIFWNHRFRDIIRRTPDNQRLILDIHKIHMSRRYNSVPSLNPTITPRMAIASSPGCC